MDGVQVASAIDDMLGAVMEPRWLNEWWDAEVFWDQTPRQMLEGRRFRQLWLIAEATASPDGRDITEVEHIRD